MSMTQTILGIDVGATGVKGGLVNMSTGELVHERIRILTPQPATPAAVAGVIGQIVKKLDYKGQVGVGFPSIIKDGYCASANNIDPSWIGMSVSQYLEKHLSLPVRVLNDADCAGLAEAHFGVIKGVHGVSLLLTIGTGIGSALFYNGHLIPNIELGNLRMEKQDEIGERYVSNKARKDHGLSWKSWANRFNKYLHLVEDLFSPERIVLGGGISKKFDTYHQYFTVKTEVMPARLFNDSGIIGAAMLWSHEGVDWITKKPGEQINW